MMRLETKNWPRPITNMQINRNPLQQAPRRARQGIIMLLVGALKPATRRIFWTLLFVGGFCTHSIAELQPSEIAIVAARGNRDSEGLARYYARMRGVPPENICLVQVPSGEVCQREIWQSAIRPEIHKWLNDKDPQQKIRCLVTMFGVPLKIGPAAADAQLLRYQQFLAAERSHRLQLFTEVLDGFNNLGSNETGPKATEAAPKAEGTTANPAEKPAAGTIATAPSLPTTNSAQPLTGPTDQPATEISRFQAKLETALQAAQLRVEKLTHEEERGRATARLQQLATAVGGLNVLLPAINQRITSEKTPNPATRSEFDTIRGRLLGYVESKGLLEQMPAGIERDGLILALVERIGGMIASVQWLDQQLEVAKKNETGASFDSELTLVMWPDDYQLLRWQPNYLRPAFSNSQLPNSTARSWSPGSTRQRSDLPKASSIPRSKLKKRASAARSTSTPAASEKSKSPTSRPAASATTIVPCSSSPTQSTSKPIFRWSSRKRRSYFSPVNARMPPSTVAGTASENTSMPSTGRPAPSATI